MAPVTDPIVSSGSPAGPPTLCPGTPVTVATELVTLKLADGYIDTCSECHLSITMPDTSAVLWHAEILGAVQHQYKQATGSFCFGNLPPFPFTPPPPQL